MGPIMQFCARQLVRMESSFWVQRGISARLAYALPRGYTAFGIFTPDFYERQKLAANGVFFPHKKRDLKIEKMQIQSGRKNSKQRHFFWPFFDQKWSRWKCTFKMPVVMLGSSEKRVILAGIWVWSRRPQMDHFWTRVSTSIYIDFFAHFLKSP